MSSKCNRIIANLPTESGGSELTSVLLDSKSELIGVVKINYIPSGTQVNDVIRVSFELEASYTFVNSHFDMKIFGTGAPYHAIVDGATSVDFILPLALYLYANPLEARLFLRVIVKDSEGNEIKSFIIGCTVTICLIPPPSVTVKKEVLSVNSTEIKYNITVDNPSRCKAFGVELSDVLPEQFGNWVTDQGSIEDNTLLADIGTLNSNSFVKIHLTGTGESVTGIVSNTAVLNYRYAPEKRSQVVVEIEAAQ